MKNFLLSTALILSTATFAGAASHSQIAMQVDNSLAAMSMNVDIDSLTEDQVSALYLVLTSAESGDRNAAVRAVLDENNVKYEEEEDTPMAVMVPRSQLRAAVVAQSAELGLTDMRIRSLNDEQLSALYLLANSDAMDKQIQAKSIIE